MTKRFRFVLAFALLAGGRSADAACGWFGTQLECALGSAGVVIGTQTAADPAYATSVRPWSFGGDDHLLDDRRPTTPFGLQLQDIGTDPTLCHRFGNETYCY
jgi:hypothetical protein